LAFFFLSTVESQASEAALADGFAAVVVVWG
jgi:hypothetical protein